MRLPSKVKAMRSPLAKIAYPRRPSVAIEEEAKPVVSGISGDWVGLPGTFVTTCRQTRSPFFIPKQNTSRFTASPPERKIQSLHTMGELKPLAGTAMCHARPAPVFTSQTAGRLVKIETPLPSGPRKRGQLRFASSIGAASVGGLVAGPESTNFACARSGRAEVRRKLNPSSSALMAMPVAATDHRDKLAVRGVSSANSVFGFGIGRRF